MGQGSGESKIYCLADLSEVGASFAETVYFGEKYFNYLLTKVVDHTFSWYISTGSTGGQFNDNRKYCFLCVE